jgi:hypothetical protein
MRWGSAALALALHRAGPQSAWPSGGAAVAVAGSVHCIMNETELARKLWAQPVR